MLVALPFIAGLLLFGVCCTRGKSWRRAWVEGMTLWGAYLAGTTELLNGFAGIDRRHVALAWSGLALTCGCIVLLRFLRGGMDGRTPDLKDWRWTDWLSLVPILIVLALTGVAALVSPPNSSDVMEYHLPRVVQWIQRGSLAYYPTHDCAQLFYPPFAEWAILHLHLLAGSDRFSNLGQWFSFLGCILAASYAAELLGARRRGQWIAALLCATLPIGLLAASGAKNDLVLACWILIGGVFALDLCRKHSTCKGFPTDVLWLGLATGLAILTKGTALLLCPALLAGCLLPCLTKPRPAQVVAWLLIPLVVVVLNAGHFVRNARFSGSPLGLSSPSGDGRQSLRIKHVSIREAVANGIRNVALHLGTDNVRLNRRINSLLRASISLMGVDPDDKDATRAEFRVNPHTYNEYFAGSPLHFLLFCLAMAWAFLRWRNWPVELLVFILGIVGASVLFATFLPWWPTSARLHTALLVFSAPALGVLLERAWRPLTAFVLICACVVAMKTVFKNQFRPLVATRGTTSIFEADRWSLYFADIFWRRSSYTEVVAAIKQGQCREIGIDTALPDLWEYPLLWALGAARGQSRVWDVGVSNPSARLAGSFEARAPCAVICIECREDKAKQARYGQALAVQRNFGRLVLFQRPGGALPTAAAR
jgi:hypothetical protein